MQSLNINRKTTDSFYRYKMPKLVAKIEGRGNGIKTVISNLVEIAKSLNRPPLYPLKFIGCELGTQTATDFKNDRYIINGAHDSEKLQSMLFMFIEKFVLCKKCHNPETTLNVLTKKEKIVIKCAACGHQSALTNSSRVTSYILKNPPKSTTDSYSKSSKTRQIDQEMKQTKKSQNGDIDSTAATTTSPDTTIQASIPDLSVKPADDENKNSELSDFPMIQNDIMEMDSVTSAETNQLTERLKVLCHESDSSRPLKERVAIFEKFFMERYTKDKNMMLYINELLVEIKRLDISSKAIIAVCECVFNDNLLDQLKLNCIPFALITFENDRAQSYLLECIEKIISENQQVLLYQVSTIFKILYDMDVVSEEVFLKWETKKSFRWIDSSIHDKIRAAAAQFLDWLKTEEEDNDSEEEDSDDDTNLSGNDTANNSITHSPEFNPSDHQSATAATISNVNGQSYDWTNDLSSNVKTTQTNVDSDDDQNSESDDINLDDI